MKSHTAHPKLKIDKNIIARLTEDQAQRIQAGKKADDPSKASFCPTCQSCPCSAITCAPTKS